MKRYRLQKRKAWSLDNCYQIFDNRVNLKLVTLPPGTKQKAKKLFKLFKELYE